MLYLVVAWVEFNQLMSNCCKFKSERKMRLELTSYLKPNESEEKRENSNNPPPRWYRYYTSINQWENVLSITTLFLWLSGRALH